MNSWRWIAAGTGLTTLLPAALMYWHPSLGSAAAVVMWSAAASVIAFWMSRRREQQHMASELVRLEEAVKDRAIQTLNHHRHDWMNELQIMYGYIQLGKHDKSVLCVERIKERMLQDSKVSKLGIPSLVFYLHAYRSYNPALPLEVEVVDQVHLNEKLPVETQQALTEAVITVVDRYQQAGMSSSPEEEKQLILTFWEQEDGCIAEFEGEGEFGDRLTLEQQLHEAVNNTVMRVEQVDTGHMTYRLCVPYVT
ncbi:Spo0B domain-containing protein [Paenibacillus lemnae]|uniref:SpoOB alpha-helical domain-containing protein n=1 Tax=Paenibacillus lemnae TaxID=1330551 RepID=A0A848M4X5_PAELE|nr:Spo0B domain-containing protein [Paenibacillus lemnae]NMO95319.1 hypothetical protein [Paenibacillus lemnae]